MILQKRKELFRRFFDQNPNPTTELIFSTPFELLIAVVLSAQATDLVVNKATAKLFAIANTPKAILLLGSTELEKFIKSINYYPTKAKHIIHLCKILLARHKGQVPRTRAALEALPGVGRKSANVILNTIFKKPVIAVDTHIFRVSNRTGLAQGKTVLEVEKKLTRAVPSPYRQQAHHWLVLHGRYVCTARAPHCGNCLIRDLCEYPNKS